MHQSNGIRQVVYGYSFLICKVFDNVCERIIYAECHKIITGKGEGSGSNHSDNRFVNCICAQYRFLSFIIEDILVYSIKR